MQLFFLFVFVNLFSSETLTLDTFFFTLFRLVVHNVVKNKYQINKSMYLLQRNIQQAKKYIARFKRDENENKLWKIVYLEKWVKDKNCFLQFLPLENDLLSLSENSREYTL